MQNYCTNILTEILIAVVGITDPQNDDDAALKAKIEEQLRRNRHLLDALSVKERMEKLREKQDREKQLERAEKEVRFSEDEDTYDSTEESFDMDTQTIEKYDVDAGTQTGKDIGT